MQGKPIIYGWEKQQNYLKVLSLVEAIRRGIMLPEYFVNSAAETYNNKNNSFGDDVFLLALVQPEKIGIKKKKRDEEYYIGGHHRIIAEEITDKENNMKVIPPNGFHVPFSNRHIVSVDSKVTNIYRMQGLPITALPLYLEAIWRDERYINVLKIKEYKPIIKEMEKSASKSVSEFKALVRDNISV